jgi:hypothetical protein
MAKDTSIPLNYYAAYAQVNIMFGQNYSADS